MKLILAAPVAALALALGASGASAQPACQNEIEKPTADFGYSPNSPQPGSTVAFDASGSAPGSHAYYSYDATIDDCVLDDSGTDPVESYEWHWGDGSANTTTTSPTVSHTFASPGAYTVTLKVYADSGSDTTATTVKTAWVVTLTAPAAPANAVLSHKRGTIALAATASGPAAIQRMEFFVRGAKVGEDTTAPYTASFDSASMADGDAGLYAKVTGTDTTAGVSATRNVIIDNTAPAYTILEGASVVKPGQDRFRVRFTDDGYLYGNPLCWADAPEPVDWDYCIGGGVEKTFDGAYTYALPEGQHTVYFRASDAAGNVTTGSASVRVDGTAPETTIGDDFTAGSNESEVTFRCRVYPDGGAAADFGACPAARSGLAPGAYRYEAVAVDAAGNEDPTPASRTFTVAAPPPAGGGDPAGGGQQEQRQGGGQVGQQSTGGSQGGVTSAPPVRSKPGKCSKLKGKKRAACVKKSCAKLKKKKHGAKRYKACVKKVTRKG